MKVMNIVGYRRTKKQKVALKTKRAERRYKRAVGEYNTLQHHCLVSIARSVFRRGRKMTA